jgi:hypothetical protein
MPTPIAPFSLRQSIAMLLRDDPELAFELASRAGAPELPDGLKIRSVDTEYPDPHDPSKVHRTDLVLVAYASFAGLEIPVQAVVVEVLDRVDPSRPPGWMVYPEAVRQRYGCPGRVVIFALDSEVRDWANAQALTGGSALH